MDYQALELGEAASVVTAVTVDNDAHMIRVFCLYDPQETLRPYILCFTQCEHLVWQPLEALPDLQHVEAELLGISLGRDGVKHQAVLTTDVFELSFVYGNFSLQTSTAAYGSGT